MNRIQMSMPETFTTLVFFVWRCEYAGNFKQAISKGPRRSGNNSDPGQNCYPTFSWPGGGDPRRLGSYAPLHGLDRSLQLPRGGAL